MVCETWDVVVVPFPFSDRPGTKRRPALVLSRSPLNRSGHTILAMITTRSEPAWPGDHPIRDAAESGLPRASIVRLKLFTLDNRLLLRRAGRLSPSDQEAVRESLRSILAGT